MDYLSGAGILALVAGAGWYFHRRWVLPLRNLEQFLSSILSGTPDARMPVEGSSAHRKIASHVNHLRERLHFLQQQISKEEINLNTILDNMVEGVIITNNRGEITMANKPVIELFGIRSPWIGITLLEATRNHHLETLVSRTLQAESFAEIELEVGSLESKVVNVHAAAIRKNSENPWGVILVFHDLTRIRKLENARKEFVANVSHELRTPLSIIKGYIETLMDGALEDRETAKRFLNIMQRHSERLQFLIEDLLMISSLESNQIQMQMEIHDLEAFLEETLLDYDSMAKENQIQLNLRKGNSPSPCTACFDPERLQQVICNLVENAIKYNRPDGAVMLEIVLRDDAFVEVVVRDTGVGIPARDLPHVFERFYRVDKARSRSLGGTGLGLSIVKHIILSHGGQVWAESEPGKGSAFHFTLRKAPLVTSELMDLPSGSSGSQSR